MKFKKLSTYLRKCKIAKRYDIGNYLLYYLSCPELVTLECVKDDCIETFHQQRIVKRIK